MKTIVNLVLIATVFNSCGQKNATTTQNSATQINEPIHIAESSTTFVPWLDGVWFPKKLDPSYVDEMIRTNTNFWDFSWGRGLHFRDMETGYPQYGGAVIESQRGSFGIGFYLLDPGYYNKYKVINNSDINFLLQFENGEKLDFHYVDGNTVTLTHQSNENSESLTLFRVSGPGQTAVRWNEGDFNPIKGYDARMKILEGVQN